MLRGLTRHMRHNTVAYLALFFALTGTAVAAAPLMTGAKIHDGTINSDDLRDRGSAAYPGPSIQGKDVEANTLSAAEIDEPGLDTVADADKLDGKDSVDFAGSGQSCNAGDVVTGISTNGSIVCSGTEEGGGETPGQDLCDGVDDDQDGEDGEDDPRVGEPAPEGGTIRCIDGKLVAYDA